MPKLNVDILEYTVEPYVCTWVKDECMM